MELAEGKGAFLGVENSLTGRRWRGPGAEAQRQAEALVQQAGVSGPMATVLARLGILPDAVPGFLKPTLRELLPDPLSLRDSGKAAERLVTAALRRQRVAVFADYDVDGGASAALLMGWFAALGITPTLYVPDRIDEGYGPNAPAMTTLAAQHDLIVCVDCGTLSHEALAVASGTDVVVLDHHLGGETLPPALAVVNPNRQDEDGALGHLCAAGVVFLVLVEANRQMRGQGRAGPDLMSALDLVALATVADVAPLIGVNRALVRTGLQVMARRDRVGLRSLADVAGLDEAPRAYHLGYLLGPRINAGGRIGRADLGARLLATTDPGEAAGLAEELDKLNRARRAIETEVTEAALAQAEVRGTDGPLVWAAGEGWHPGVVGIVASRLKEATNRPAVVIGLEGGLGKGSGRSVNGVDLGASVQRLAAEGLLLKGGGHRMAAGLTVEAGQLDAAMTRLAALLERQGAGQTGPRDLPIDSLLMPGAVTVELVAALEEAGPFGASASAPRFALPDVAITHVRKVGTAHLKLTLGDGAGGRLEAIAFGAADGPIGAAVDSHRSARFHVAGRIEINSWGGRQKPQLRVEDMALVQGERSAL